MPETPVTFTYLQRALEEGSPQLIGEVGSERVEYGMAIEGNPAHVVSKGGAQPRSRNNNGAWRRKRSDAGKARKK